MCAVCSAQHTHTHTVSGSETTMGKLVQHIHFVYSDALLFDLFCIVFRREIYQSLATLPSADYILHNMALG